MGIVVAAMHVDLGQRVAVKFMRPAMAVHPDQRERFLREARAAVLLRSQHVARMLDVGTLEDGLPYIVMELLEGRDLAALLKAEGPQAVSDAVEFVLQVCEAVGEAHAAGIVHRDLKPANLFVTQDVSGSPCVKVLDFGISKIVGADLAITDDDQALGSPLYMSPEQMRSPKDVDARTDIWALGVVLYELLAGLTPFHAETTHELWGRIIMGQVTPLGERRSEVPPGLDAAILRCLRADLEQRWQNAAEFASALAPYAPPRARAYPERVAHVLGVLSPSAAQATASSPAATAGSGSVESTTPLPHAAAIPPPPAAELPAAMASSPLSAGGETSLALMSSRHGHAQPSEEQPARPHRRAPVLVAIAIAAVAALTAIFVAASAWDPPAAPTPTPAAPLSTMTAAPPAAARSSQDPPALSPLSSDASSHATSIPPAASTATAEKPPPRLKSPAKAAPQAKPQPTVSYDDRQ
jgi:eukaryotic-like serine/threonine-protein kinase